VSLHARAEGVGTPALITAWTASAASGPRSRPLPFQPRPVPSRSRQRPNRTTRTPPLLGRSSRPSRAGRRPWSRSPSARGAGPGSCRPPTARKEGVRLAQKMQVCPCISVRIRLLKAEDMKAIGHLARDGQVVVLLLPQPTQRVRVHQPGLCIDEGPLSFVTEMRCSCLDFPYNK
jgi:hypothetical protein